MNMREPELDSESLHKQLCADTGTSAPLPFTQIDFVGPDAQDFLQGQLTLDLKQLPPEHHQLTAWCNAKGRVWAVLRIWRTQDGFSLLIPRNQAEAFVKRIRMFVLRAQVEVRTVDVAVQAEIGPETAAERGEITHEGAVRFLHHDRWHRLALGVSTTATGDDVAARYTALRMLAGEPQIDAASQEKFLPQSVGLGELGGLHFNKGCYVGQEIVARVHYRGKAPQRLKLALNANAEDLADKAVLGDLTLLDQRITQWVENTKG